MKKVLIVTLFDEFNIGNRLQNYALQSVIERYGIEVTTLDNGYSDIFTLETKIKYCIKRILMLFGYSRYYEFCDYYRSSRKRRKTIRRFNKANISIVKKTKNDKAFGSDWSDYDLAIAGSDQIWHKWRKDVNELPYYYLQFMPYDKRVAYAASFGFEDFPPENISQHRVGLQEMKSISCREKSGCELINGLIGKQVPRVLDPTLLLTANEWRKISDQADDCANQSGKYALAFFLGKMSDEYRSYIEGAMKERGIEKLIDFSDEKFKACGPCEFIKLIDNAQFIFTDSFHCVVFSTIFEKDFLAFRRIQSGFEKMFGRIEDLLSSVNRLDCIYGGTQCNPNGNFEELYNESIKYIETVLGIANEN